MSIILVPNLSQPLTFLKTDFQNAKKTYQKNAKVPQSYEQEDLDRGFVVTGLWSWSRHPNYAAEQAIWILIYQWGCWTADTLFNWTLAGAVSYVILFQGSTWITELITAGKYPDYKEYQRRVGKFLPRLTSSLPEDFEETTPSKPDPKAPKATKGKKGRK